MNTAKYGAARFTEKFVADTNRTNLAKLLFSGAEKTAGKKKRLLCCRSMTARSFSGGRGTRKTGLKVRDRTKGKSRTKDFFVPCHAGSSRRRSCPRHQATRDSGFATRNIPPACSLPPGRRENSPTPAEKSFLRRRTPQPGR